MNYQNTTMIPNELFELLPTLTEKELKLILVVLRQTIGWVDKKGKRKQKDWITSRFFANKTGLSRKSVSIGLSELQQKQLIITEVNHSTMRTFYTCTLIISTKNTHDRRKIYPPIVENILPTKLRETKLNKEKKEKFTSPKKLSDLERYHQIVNNRFLDKGG